jgi:hypothetical protein
VSNTGLLEAEEQPTPPIELPDRDGMALERYYQIVKEMSSVTLERREREKIIEWEAPVDNYTGIVFIGDLHIGAPIQYDLLEGDLKLIDRTDGLYAVGMGDYADMFQAQPKLQKAMAENVVPASDDQMELVEYILGFNSKWLALLLGNHDGWAGQRGVQKLAEHLGAEYASEAGCSLKVNVGDVRYVFYLKHQWKGHSNINTSNESRRMWNEFPDFDNADVTVLAHYHQPDTHIKEIKGSSVSHLRGGTYKLHDEYSFKVGYQPAYGPSMVILCPESKEVIPFHGPLWRRGVQMLGYLRREQRRVSG